MARTQKGFARSNNAQFIVVKDHNISRVNLVTIAIDLNVQGQNRLPRQRILLHPKCQYTNYIFTLVDIIKVNIVIGY